MAFWESLVPLLLTGAGTAVGGPVGGAVGGALGGAVTGGAKNKEQQRREAESRALRAAEIRNAPYTGRTTFSAITPAEGEMANILGGAMAGGETGGSFAKSLGKLDIGGLLGGLGKTRKAPASGSRWEEMAVQDPTFMTAPR